MSTTEKSTRDQNVIAEYNNIVKLLKNILDKVSIRADKDGD